MALRICLWLVTAFVYVYGGNGPTIDGGSGGADFLDWFDGTPNTKKIVLGAHCSIDSKSSSDATTTMYAFQPDEDFEYSSLSHQDGQRVRYETCYLLDAGEYMDTKQAVNATNCNNIEFEFLSTTAGDEYSNWTMWKEVTFDRNDLSNIGCGAFVLGTDIIFVVSCKRQYGYDQAYDVIYTVEVGTAFDDCLVREISNDTVKVDDAPRVNVSRRVSVDLKAYSVSDPSKLKKGPSGADEDGAAEVTTPKNLGDLIFLEVCLKIESPDVQYFTNTGFSPIGVKVGGCYASPLTVGTNSIVPEDTEQPIVDANSCGLGDLPVAAFRPDEHIFGYVPDTVVSVEGWMRSPNCFRSPIFELATFQRIHATDSTAIVFVCNVTYCNTTEGSDGQECFGEGSISDPDYSNSCGDSRKKRDTLVDYPQEVSAVVYVKQRENVTIVQEQSGCFEKNTFIGLSSALAVLLIVVLIVASYLAFRVWSDVDDNRSRSTDSMTGLKNKSYY